ncbi:MAG: MATE family efflux transporter [Lachnospiraceae bacterium]|nr:MATE family efflux transporter [Lachnospiraceae bacterium]
MDMINGSIADKIIKFAIPLAITGILQQVFNAMDVMIVGRYASKNAMAAVGCNAPVIGLMINLFIGISLGANVTIARYIGQVRHKDVKKAVHTAIIIGVISGFLVAFLGLVVSRPLLTLMGVPQEVFPMALIYLRIYLMGMPVILLYNFEAAIFRSCGDTRTPLFCLIIAGTLNVMLNLFFVRILHMDADGVAIATVASNMVSAGIMFVILLRTKSVVRVDFKSFRIDPHIFRVMIRIGVPAGVQAMVFSFSNMIIQSAINSLGADIMAASSAAFNIEIFTYYIVNAFGQACTTFTGQNYGAKKIDRCKKVARYSFMMDLVSTLAMSALIFVFADKLVFLFNEDPAVISYGAIRVRYIMAFYLVNMSIEIISGILRGYGNSLAPAIIAFAGICGTRIAWVYTVFLAHPTFQTLLSCYPISWAVTASILLIYYIFYIKKMRRGFDL